MTVVDIRNIFSDRNIELVDVNDSCIYYAEEKNEEGHNNLFILEYNRATRRERLVTNYSLEDPTFVEHIFAFEKTIAVILENGTNSMWLIEIDKQSGTELTRRKVVCTGSFSDCMALDNEHILIYMAPDEANAEMFKKYREVTGSECFCYLYNLKTNKKFFVKNSLIAKIGCDGIKPLDVHGEKYLVLLDPFADESIKEHYYKEQRWINADIRDNIWLCNLSELENELENGCTEITKKCIASADIKALVRYIGTEGEKVYFRAKEFRTGLEKLCSYDAFTNSLDVEATLTDPQDNRTVYLIEEKPTKVFCVTKGSTKVYVKGILNSTANLSYDNSLGEFMTCIENRFVVTQRSIYSEESKSIFTYYYIYDSQLDKSESYECKCHVYGDTLVLY